MDWQNEDTKKNQVEVNLFGDRYYFRGESPEAIREAGQVVSGEIEKIYDEFPNLGRHRVLVLALMKLGDTVVKLRKENDELLELFSREE